MGRRSSLHEHFVRVKTSIGLERFEVENLELFSIFPGNSGNSGNPRNPGIPGIGNY